MPVLSSHCVRHADRPAVARCPSCRQSFCRECVVEHDFRLICADCLRDLIADRHRGPARSWLARWPLAALMQGTTALVVTWLVFYIVALLLRRIPADIHDGLIWNP